MTEDGSVSYDEDPVDVATVDAEAFSGGDPTHGRVSTALTDPSRRVLVALLSGPYVDGRKDDGRWSHLLRDRDAIEARLADLFLELVIDDDAQVAFVRQSEADPESPKLLRRLNSLNRLDSVLLLVLRQHLMTQLSRGQRAVIDVAEIEESLAAYRRTESTDETGFARDVRASINKMQRHQILEPRGEAFEVSPVLRMLVGPDEARELIRLYEKDGDAAPDASLQEPHDDENAGDSAAGAANEGGDE